MSGTVRGPTQKSGTGRRTLWEVWDGPGALEEVRDRSEDHREGPRRVGGPLGRSGTGQGTLEVIWAGSGDPRGGSGRVG